MKTLKDLAARLFRVSPPPSARLSYVLGVRQRQAQYWLSGQHETPPDVIETMEHQIRAVDEFDLEGKIERLITKAGEAGIKPSVTAHFLDAAVEKLKDQANNPSSGIV